LFHLKAVVVADRPEFVHTTTHKNNWQTFLKLNAEVENGCIHQKCLSKHSIRNNQIFAHHLIDYLIEFR